MLEYWRGMCIISIIYVYRWENFQAIGGGIKTVFVQWRDKNLLALEKGLDVLVSSLLPMNRSVKNNDDVVNEVLEE